MRWPTLLTTLLRPAHLCPALSAAIPAAAARTDDLPIPSCPAANRSSAPSPLSLSKAVRLLSTSEETKALSAGYRADFAVVARVADTAVGTADPTEQLFQTCLVEVNDGYVSGRYDGMPPKDFTGSPLLPAPRAL